ncbi:MAG: xanthan lyase [Candidatus Cryptobacteroides sp.]
MKTFLGTLTMALIAPWCIHAQNSGTIFKESCDSMSVLMKERSGVTCKFKVLKHFESGKTLHLRFSQELGDFPWREADVNWFKSTFGTILPSRYSGFKVGNVTVAGNPVENYMVAEAGNDGSPRSLDFSREDPGREEVFIRRVGEQEFDKGLYGRTIALWQSHGRYYDSEQDRWDWQRAPLFQTVEDMYTQTYVLPFLIPMLENAGAYVMTPRERDIQTREVIADNDPAFSGHRKEGVRVRGRYSEKGEWTDAGTGFADAKPVYTGIENPFTMGTARSASCRSSRNSAVWEAEFPERGEYSVYISYKSLPNSTGCALYRVCHLGGTSDFIVNQKMGGGTWIYLGTFEFEGKGEVIMSSDVPEGYDCPDDVCITADAVRFGGGMGKIARGRQDLPASEYSTSGMPSFCEGAIYWMQWAGADSTLLAPEEGDYVRDYSRRGAWVGWMSGGSRTNPEAEGLGIPVDLSLAFHTDAGVSPDDSIIGTLAIYTLKCDDSDLLPNGENRLQARTYADFVQSQIVQDIRSTFNPQWSRRGLWDRSYSESRTTTVPALLVELLSHQNFSDMKFGLDPSFRFVVCRSVYKGILKYLSARYGCPYQVQPLPVQAFSSSFNRTPSNNGDTEVTLSWKAATDSLEHTAVPEGYILYTRIDDGAFDNGKILKSIRTDAGTISTEVSIEPGHIYSYRIVAFNEGGRSFPSQTLSVGIPEGCKGESALVVDNFTRVSAPAWMDSPQIAGFDSNLDGGVPYIREIGFIGEQYQFNREMPWMSNENPGFGGSYTDKAATVYPGNSLDNTVAHGKALMEAGYAYHSVTAEAFDIASAKGDMMVDIVCGKQVSTPVGISEGRISHGVFPSRMQKTIREYTASGGNVLVSGAYIGTDIWSSIYPIVKDSIPVEESKRFASEVLGYKWMTNYASRCGEVWPMTNKGFNLASRIGKIAFHQEKNATIYNVETPDGIVPAGADSHSVLRYTDTNISAAVFHNGRKYKTACFGFPLETLKKQEDINLVIRSVSEYFGAR